MTSSSTDLATGRAPAVGAVPPRHVHTSVGGFCGVCGSVWPCKRAGVDASPVAAIPVARW
jgi:hypothetical protein